MRTRESAEASSFLFVPMSVRVHVHASMRMYIIMSLVAKESQISVHLLNNC